MHPCAMLLGEVLSLSQLEEEALLSEDLEQAEDLAQKRAELIDQAWEKREGYDNESLLNSLLVIQAMQSRLMEIAGDIRKKLGSQMQTTKKQEKYFGGYRHRRDLSEKALHFNKVS